MDEHGSVVLLTDRLTASALLRRLNGLRTKRQGSHESGQPYHKIIRQTREARYFINDFSRPALPSLKTYRLSFGYWIPRI